MNLQEIFHDDIQYEKIIADSLRNDKGGVKNMSYEEVNPDFWIPETENEFIEGVLISKKQDVGVNKSCVYVVETSLGVKNVWGSTILDSRMDLIEVGSKIKILYKGLGEKKGGKNPPKIFKVYIDRE